MTLIGVIVDKESGLPVAGATIARVINGNAIPVAAADANGVFSIDDGGYPIAITAVDYVPVLLEVPHISGQTYRMIRDYESLPDVVIGGKKNVMIWAALLGFLFFVKK